MLAPVLWRHKYKRKNLQATSRKRQASSATKKTQLKDIVRLESMTEKTEKKRKELLHFIKTVGAPHIFTMYNFYLKETECEELIPDGPEDPVLDV